jgi:ABC-type transport system involved in cytochrome c biogenesis ATPase subunit
MITELFNNDVKAEDVKAEMVRTHIGPYNAWLENGSLHIYGHQVGHATGLRLSMTPQETHRFLEWLSDNQETISRAFPHSLQMR